MVLLIRRCSVLSDAAARIVVTKYWILLHIIYLIETLDLPLEERMALHTEIDNTYVHLDIFGTTKSYAMAPACADKSALRP